MFRSLEQQPSNWAETRPVKEDAAVPPRAEPRVLKAIVMVLALLATAKVGIKEYLFHASSAEVITAAYRDRAADACRQNPRAADFGLGASNAFTEEALAAVTIGKPGLDVYLWQTEHPKWDARYRNPYLHLTVPNRTGGGAIACEYDIVNARASLRRR